MTELLFDEAVERPVRKEPLDGHSDAVRPPLRLVDLAEAARSKGVCKGIPLRVAVNDHRQYLLI